MLSQRKMLDSFDDKNLFIFPTEIHVVEKIEIISCDSDFIYACF